MNFIDLTPKEQLLFIGTSIGAFISWLVGGLGLAFVVLFGMMALDFVTGFLLASMRKEVNSSIGKEGLIKKLLIIVLIGACYLLQLLATFLPDQLSSLKLAGNFADGVCIGFVIIEFVSIFENVGKAGVKIPKFIQDKILVLNRVKEGKGESENG